MGCHNCKFYNLCDNKDNENIDCHYCNLKPNLIKHLLKDLEKEKNKEFFYIPLNKFGMYTPGVLRCVTKVELDDILSRFRDSIFEIISNGSQGAMTMWACFKNSFDTHDYGDVINAYRLLSGDNKALSEREHELRHLCERYRELHYIRYYGSVVNYHLTKALRAIEEEEAVIHK